MTWSACFAADDFDNRKDTVFVITSGKGKKKKKKKEYLFFDIEK